MKKEGGGFHVERSIKNCDRMCRLVILAQPRESLTVFGGSVPSGVAACSVLGLVFSGAGLYPSSFDPVDPACNLNIS